jgi:hypothetical protein
VNGKEQKVMVDCVWIFELKINDASFYFYLNQRKNELFPDDKIYYKNDIENYTCPFTKKHIDIQPFYKECVFLKEYTDEIASYILTKSTQRLRIRLNHDFSYYTFHEYMEKKLAFS